MVNQLPEEVLNEWVLNATDYTPVHNLMIELIDDAIEIGIYPIVKQLQDLKIEVGHSSYGGVEYTSSGDCVSGIGQEGHSYTDEKGRLIYNSFVIIKKQDYDRAKAIFPSDHKRIDGLNGYRIAYFGISDEEEHQENQENWCFVYWKPQLIEECNKSWRCRICSIQNTNTTDGAES